MVNTHSSANEKRAVDLSRRPKPARKVGVKLQSLSKTLTLLTNDIRWKMLPWTLLGPSKQTPRLYIVVRIQYPVNPPFVLSREDSDCADTRGSVGRYPLRTVIATRFILDSKLIRFIAQVGQFRPA